MASQPQFQPIDQINVQDFADRLQDVDSPVQLIDVREPQELELARLEGFLNLPLSRFPEWSGHICNQLNLEIETIVMCHHGVRSAQMCAWLSQQGFLNVKNLEGGIDAYAIRVDRQVPRY